MNIKNKKVLALFSKITNCKLYGLHYQLGQVVIPPVLRLATI